MRREKVERINIESKEDLERREEDMRAGEKDDGISNECYLNIKQNLMVEHLCDLYWKAPTG